MKHCIMVLLFMLMLPGCGKRRVYNVHNETYIYNDYDITELHNVCNELSDGDSFVVDDMDDSRIVKNGDQCVLRFVK